MATFPKSILKKTKTDINHNSWHFEAGSEFFDMFDVFCGDKFISRQNFERLPSYVKKKTNTPISEGQGQLKIIGGDIFLVFQVNDELIQYKYIGTMYPYMF